MTRANSFILIGAAIFLFAFVVAWGDSRVSPFPVDFYDDSTHVAQRTGLNLISGTGITVTSADAVSDQRVNFTITAAAAETSAPIAIEEDDVEIDPNPTVIDFGAGIDCSESPEDEINCAIDPTEIGTTTWGSGSAVVWTVDASAGTDTTLTFGDGTITLGGPLIEITGTEGINYTPGSDRDVNLITVDVTGNPTFSWDESENAFSFLRTVTTEQMSLGDPHYDITIGGATIDAKLSIDAEGAAALGMLILSRHDTSTPIFGSHIMLTRTQGTHASPTVVADNDNLGALYGLGYDGTDYGLSSSIVFEVDDPTPAATDMGGAIVFSTAAAGTEALTEQWRIDNAGQLLGAAENELRLTSATVAHGMTDVAPTNVWGRALISVAGDGGLHIQGFKDADSAGSFGAGLTGHVGDAQNTTKSTAGRGVVELAGYLISGATYADNQTADGNLLAVRTRRGAAFETVFILDEDGDIWMDGTGLTSSGALTITTGGSGNLALSPAGDLLLKDDSVLEEDMKAVDAAVDEECLTYESTTGDFEWQTCGTGAVHALLNGSVHTDTVAQIVSRGSLIYGDSTPSWNELVVGGAGEYLQSDGTDISWGAISGVLSDTGDTGTGVYDFGGADSFEIVNAAGPTVNAAGEIAIDTTDDQLVYYGGAERVLPYKRHVSITIEDPVDADNIMISKLIDGMYITDVHCLIDPGDVSETLVIDVQERDGSGDNPATFDSTITCDNDGAEDDGTIANPTFDAGDWWSVDIGTASGTIDFVTISTYYSTVRE